MADIDNLRAVAREILDDWPEGVPDGFTLQDLAVKHGLLMVKDPKPTEPCGEHCWCADYYGDEHFAAGAVECYIRSPLLLGTDGVAPISKASNEGGNSDGR